MRKNLSVREDRKKSELDIFGELLLSMGYRYLSTIYMVSPAPVAQSVAFALPKTDCWEDLDRIPPGDNEIEMKGLGT